MNILKHGEVPSVKFECHFCGCEWSADAGEYSADTRYDRGPAYVMDEVKIVRRCYRTATMACPECGAFMESRLETTVVDVEED